MVNSLILLFFSSSVVAIIRRCTLSISTFIFLSLLGVLNMILYLFETSLDFCLSSYQNYSFFYAMLIICIVFDLHSVGPKWLKLSNLKFVHNWCLPLLHRTLYPTSRNATLYYASITFHYRKYPFLCSNCEYLVSHLCCFKRLWFESYFILNYSLLLLR